MNYFRFEQHFEYKMPKAIVLNVEKYESLIDLFASFIFCSILKLFIILKIQSVSCWTTTIRISFAYSDLHNCFVARFCISHSNSTTFNVCRLNVKHFQMVFFNCNVNLCNEFDRRRVSGCQWILNSIRVGKKECFTGSYDEMIF